MMGKNMSWNLGKKILGLILVLGVCSVALILYKNSTNAVQKIHSVPKKEVTVQKTSKLENSNCDFISSVPMKSETKSANTAKVQSSPNNNVKAEKVSKKIDDCVFTVKGVSESMDNGQITASEGNKLVCINLKVENKGTEEQQMTSIMMFTLADSKQVKYNIATPEGDDSINGILSPNESITGQVWFEVPKAEKKFQFTISPSMQEQNSGILNIDTTGATNTVEDKKDDQKQEKKNTTVKKISGKEVKIGNLVFKLGSISTEDVSTLRAEDEDYKILNIEVSVKNNGAKEEQMTSNMIFKLMDEEGEACTMVLPEKAGVNGLLKANEKLSGRLSFKVRRDKDNYKLEIKPWAMKQVKASLDIET